MVREKRIGMELAVMTNLGFILIFVGLTTALIVIISEENKTNKLKLLFTSLFYSLLVLLIFIFIK